MNRSVSSFLDLSRFLAALVVLLDHIDTSWVIGAAPFFRHLGAEAVGCFFVISGYVIAYVASTRETKLPEYAMSRITRIYSVVIPCLATTFILDAAGRHFFAEFYSTNWPPTMSDGREMAKMLFSLTFLNQCWSLDVYPGSNVPYWSICFEVFYYVVFASAVYMRGYFRVITVIAILTCAGPQIIEAIFLWLVGVGLFYHQPNIENRPRAGVLMIIVTVVIWTIIEAVRWHNQFVEYSTVGWAKIWQMYEGGAAFAVILAGVVAIGGRWKASQPIALLSSSTFALYLIHYPLGHFLAAVLPHGTGSPIKYFVFLLTPILAAVTITPLTEKFRDWMRSEFARVGCLLPTQQPRP